MSLKSPSRQEPKITTAQTIPEILRGLARQGTPIPLGFPAMDRQFRQGGIPPGRIFIVGGPPEAGKTTLLCQIVANLSTQYPTYCLFKDEGRDQAAVKIGTQLGFPNRDVELAAEPTIDQIEERLAMSGAILQFGDPDAPGASLESAIEEMREIMPPVEGQPRVLVLDSIQTVPAFKEQNAEGPIGQLTELMVNLRSAARAENLLILATSQVNRGFYQKKDPSERNNALAAFLGASGIEFGLDVGLAIHPAVEGVAQAEIVKNRLRFGPSVHFSIRINYSSLKVEEVDRDASQDEALATARAAVANHKATILSTLRKHPSGLQSGHLREACGGKKTVHLQARRELIDESKIVMNTDSRYPIFLLVPEFS